jgi:DNA-binding FadR family transcriptional regulator
MISEPAFEPTQVLRPRQQVESQLRQAILDGLFSQGDKLPSEAQLAAQFGVSRTTIREALRSLADDGLIFKLPGATGGSFVMAVDHLALSGQLGQSVETTLRLGSVSYEELMAVRRIIEPPNAALAAAQRTSEHVALLEDALSRQRSVTVADPEIEDFDIEFHSIIANAAKNRLLSAFITALHRVARPVQYLHMTSEEGREIVKQHRAIVDAIRQQDVAGAEQLMAAHIDFVISLEADVSSRSRGRDADVA